MIRQSLLERFTNLGDPTLLLLGGFGVFFYLWIDDHPRALARSWAVAFGLCVFLTIASKLALHLLSEGERNSLSLQSPSGHVAIATSFYGCCALLLAAGRRRAARALICVGTAMLVGMLAASRIKLGLHTIPEIVAGFAIGAVCLALFRAHMSGARRIVVNASQLSALLLLIGVTHYWHVDGEPLIQRLVQKLDFLQDADVLDLAGRQAALAAQYRMRIDDGSNF